MPENLLGTMETFQILVNSPHRSTLVPQHLLAAPAEVVFQEEEASPVVEAEEAVEALGSFILDRIDRQSGTTLFRYENNSFIFINYETTIHYREIVCN